MLSTFTYIHLWLCKRGIVHLAVISRLQTGSTVTVAIGTLGCFFPLLLLLLLSVKLTLFHGGSSVQSSMEVNRTSVVSVTLIAGLCCRCCYVIGDIVVILSVAAKLIIGPV